jgi:hypothetical protein
MTTPLQHKLRIENLYERKDAIAESILKAQAKIEIYLRQREDLEQKIVALDAEILAEKERGKETK